MSSGRGHTHRNKREQQKQVKADKERRKNFKCFIPDDDHEVFQITYPNAIKYGGKIITASKRNCPDIDIPVLYHVHKKNYKYLSSKFEKSKVLFIVVVKTDLRIPNANNATHEFVHLLSLEEIQVLASDEYKYKKWYWPEWEDYKKNDQTIDNSNSNQELNINNTLNEESDEELDEGSDIEGLSINIDHI